MSAEQYRAIHEPTELLSELRRLLLAQHQADRLICRYLADLADGMEKWPAFAMICGDVHQFVRTRFGLSLRSVRERIRVGRALRQLPALEEALMSGQLTYSRIREVTRVATPDNERLWVEVAARLSIRALELRVGDASADPRDRSRRRAGPRKREKVTLSIPSDLWELLQRAMQAERTASGLELTDEEALAAVARSALAHSNTFPNTVSNTVPAERPFSAATATETTHSGSEGDGDAEAVEGRTTHSGSEGDGDAEAVEGRTTHSGLEGDGDAEAAEGGTTHSGSHGDDDAETRVDDVGQSLSPDAQLLLDLIRTGGSWDAGTLCELTQMHPSRLAYALVDLELTHLVTRGMFGVFEAARGKSGGGRFKNAG